MIRTRSRLPALALALAACAPIFSAPARAASFVVSTCEACTGSAPGDCETAPSVYGAGMTANMSRLWDFPAYLYATNTYMTLDYVSLSVFARASGEEAPETGAQVFGNPTKRVARSTGYIDDVLTAGEGSTPGFFRIPLHVTGGSAISWQNGFGVAQLVFQCSSNAPDRSSTNGQCPLIQFAFTGNEVFDTVVDLDVPIVLGQPFEYQIGVTIEVQSGHADGDLIPFLGAAQASFGSSPFAGASVLDANHVVIAGAPISASESGFVYAPEPSSATGGAAVLAAMGALRRASRRCSRRA